MQTLNLPTTYLLHKEYNNKGEDIDESRVFLFLGEKVYLQCKANAG
jgi:hypothetical protein